MSMDRRIGIDLGGTKIEGALLSEPFDIPRVEHRHRVPTGAHLGHDHIVQQVLKMIRDLEQVAGGPVPVGMGMPGSLTSVGRVKNSNTVCLNGTFFRQDLVKEFGGEIVFANDANCFALAEARFGAGRGGEVVAGLIMGTGTGGGVVINGKVRQGPQSICGEWGHTVLRPSSERSCYCGKHGCVETYLAGPWIELDYRRRGGEQLPLAEILNRRGTDQAAATCVDRWLDSFGLALANLINILDPDIVVLGGGVSNSSCLYDEGRARAERYIFSDELTTPILRHELGDSSGVLGAALLVE